MYENLLHNNLFKRRDQLLSNIDELGMSERKQDYDSKKAEFAQATEGMEATKKRYYKSSMILFYEALVL